MQQIREGDAGSPGGEGPHEEEATFSADNPIKITSDRSRSLGWRVGKRAVTVKAFVSCKNRFALLKA